MKIKSTLIIRLVSGMLIIAVCLLQGCHKQANSTADEMLTLLEFDKDFDLSRVVGADANFELIERENHKRLKVNSGYRINKPGVVIHGPEDKPWDLTGYYEVRSEVTNISDRYMQVEMFVGDDPDELIRWYCSDYVDLEPGETKTIRVFLSWTPWVFSPQFNFKGMRGAPGKLKTDPSKINQVSFNSRYATAETKFTVNSVQAIGQLEIRDTTNFYPFIDKYGQYIHENWKTKVTSDEDLKERGERDFAFLKENVGPKDIGKYGGWTAGPRLETTGFFRTQKVNDTWWLIDPEGYLFWTAGLNCMESNSVNTGVSLREDYFSFLPEKDKEYAQFYGNGHITKHGFYKEPYETFNFYQNNLYRKYGDQWLQTFQKMIHHRLKDWGMNTIGFMSDFDATKQSKTPYVGSIWIQNTPKIMGSDGFWGKFHDVFDPNFRATVRSSMEQQKEGANDPFCIGYFVDNELSWGMLGSLAEGTLKSPKNQPAKIEFVDDLKEKYGDIKTLNNAWSTSHDSWEALLLNQELPDLELANEDLIRFYRKIANTYFRIINEELKRIAPNQNYLGCRFAWANNDVVLTEASKYMDIMSFNKYEYSIANFSLPKGIDKPVMIGEFHFGSLDRGSFHLGVKAAANQEERGQMYQDYIRGALRHPNIVGAHWFQYIDEPNTGRFDGENYNVGFVDICDHPFEEVIEKVKETTYTMYEYRSNNSSK